MQYDQLSTPELKTLIRRNDDIQEEAVLELCTRHDAGDLVEFFSTLKFQPTDTLAFLQKATDLGITQQTMGTAVNLSEGAVHQRLRRARVSSARASSTPVRQTGNSDKSSKPNVISINRSERAPRQKYETTCGLGLDTRANGEQYSYQRVVIPNVLSGRLFTSASAVNRGEVDLSKIDKDQLFDLIELLQTIYRKVVH